MSRAIDSGSGFANTVVGSPCHARYPREREDTVSVRLCLIASALVRVLFGVMEPNATSDSVMPFLAITALTECGASVGLLTVGLTTVGEAVMRVRSTRLRVVRRSI